MNKDDLSKLSDEEKRIRIAEKCPRIANDNDGDGDAWVWQDYGGTWWDCHRNDPLQDLNAIAEAEKTLTNEQKGAFVDHLAGICHQVRGEPATAIQKAFFATARQRADAFLLVVG